MSADHQTASPTFTKLDGYSDNSLSYTVTAATESITAGQSYAFYLVAVNSKGSSPPSLELVVAAASPVSKPATPTRNLAMSTRESLRIEWTQSTATEVEVQGYLLYQSEGLAGNFEMVYNGSTNALITNYQATGLTVGVLHQFKVVAVNFNGNSQESDPLSVHACVAPSAPPAPERVTGTSTSITLSWTPPTDNGGCLLTGFKLFRNSGAGLNDPITTEVDPSSVGSRPALNEY
jgi:titin